jgi:hypothetical protein
MGADRMTDVMSNIKRFVTAPADPSSRRAAARADICQTRGKSGGDGNLVRPVAARPRLGGDRRAERLRRPECHPSGWSKCSRRVESLPPARIAPRILSDGSIVACEQDVLGKNALGKIGVDSIRDVWRERIGSMRADHAGGNWMKHPLCAACKEWHRP